jgi:hypothetical protein
MAEEVERPAGRKKLRSLERVTILCDASLPRDENRLQLHYGDNEHDGDVAVPGTQTFGTETYDERFAVIKHLPIDSANPNLTAQEKALVKSIPGLTIGKLAVLIKAGSYSVRTWSKAAAAEAAAAEAAAAKSALP